MPLPQGEDTVGGDYNTESVKTTFVGAALPTSRRNEKIIAVVRIKCKNIK